MSKKSISWTDRALLARIFSEGSSKYIRSLIGMLLYFISAFLRHLILLHKYGFELALFRIFNGYLTITLFVDDVPVIAQWITCLPDKLKSTWWSKFEFERKYTFLWAKSQPRRLKYWAYPSPHVSFKYYCNYLYSLDQSGPIGFWSQVWDRTLPFIIGFIVVTHLNLALFVPYLCVIHYICARRV